jgi:hypothetical protein
MFGALETDKKLVQKSCCNKKGYGIVGISQTINGYSPERKRGDG